LEVLKRETNFDLNCGGVYGGISSVRRDLFDYRGHRQLVQLLLNRWIIIGVFASLKASYEKILWERISLSLTLREMLSHTLLNDSSSLVVSKKYA
jgi:hypothetical protein